ADLPRNNIEEWTSLENGRIKTILLDILRLYFSANSDIPILKNNALKKPFISLADLLIPSILAAN
ncbi:hypothetical protein CLU79DRAFT_693577, partial [Phycomyces nitens]